MRGFFEQSTSESARSYPVVPDRQASERSIPSGPSVPGRHEGRIIYSQEHCDSAYVLRSLHAARILH
jgi:hypothetical protein